MKTNLFGTSGKEIVLDTTKYLNQQASMSRSSYFQQHSIITILTKSSINQEKYSLIILENFNNFVE